MLDVNVVRAHFARAFGDYRALDDWFSLLLQYSLVVTVADAYADFGTLGRAVLEMLASTKGVQISSEEKTRILQGMLLADVQRRSRWQNKTRFCLRYYCSLRAPLF